MFVSILRYRTAVALFIEQLQAILMRDADMKATFSVVWATCTAERFLQVKLAVESDYHLHLQ